MIGCKVAKRALVMDRLQRTDRERESQIAKIGVRSLPKVKRAKSVDFTKTYPDIVLNLSLFIVLNASWRSVHDFPRCPSWEAWSQQDHFCIQRLIHKTADSSTEIVSAHCGECLVFFNTLIKYCWNAIISLLKILGVEIWYQSERAMLQDIQ